MPRIRSRALLVVPTALIALAAFVGWPSVGQARLLPGDAFLCAEARPARPPRGGPPLPTFHARVGVSVVDRFTRPLPSEHYTLDLQKPEAFCRPVRIDDEEVADPLHGLEAYAARRTRRKPAPPPLPAVSETIDTSFGSVALRVGAVEALHVPTRATGSVGGSGPERDHFACYDVRAERGAEVRRGILRVEVRTPDGRRTVEVRKPMRLCVPASVRGDDPGAPKHPLDLLCFDARLARTESDGDAATEVLATRNAFGNEVLKAGSTRRLCVPAARSDVLVPTPTPFPTLTPLPSLTPTPTPVPTPRVPTMRIEATSTKALVRDRICLSAFLDLPDGSSVDVSTTAQWRIADGTIAASAGSEGGRKCFLGLGIGGTDVSVRDASTNVASPPVRLDYEWPIFKLDVTPERLGLRIGEGQAVTAMATFVGNRTRNVTQFVQYVSGDEAVARAPNASGNRSRIEGVGEGFATVIVRDVLSSLFDSVVVSVGALQAVTVSETAPLFPGDETHLQASGSFSGGFTSNLTQEVTYESSDPTVVLAPNAPGDRNRIQALRPGVAVVTATDPASGIRSTCCGRVSVVGEVLGIGLAPGVLGHRKGVGGDTLALRAFGLFMVPPVDQAYLAASDRFIWSVWPPGIVALAGIDGGGFQRLEPLGGGAAQVLATDPATGINGNAIVTIYDNLERLDVGTSRSDPTVTEERTIVIGGGVAYFAHGWFDGGRYRLLDEVRFEADPPGVVAFQDGVAYGIHPGTATISVVDEPTGLSSTATGGRNAILHVYGDIERLVLSPAVATLAVGEARTLTAVAYRLGGGVENFTQRVFYQSSDPNVVLAANETGNRSRLVAVGAGTATISAVDPASGVGSSASGDDTVIAVYDDRIVRIAVTPATRRVAAASTTRFVAVGYFANGDSRNLTQRVEWRSSDPSVAAAPNLTGDRSRFDALAPGVITVSAYDPGSGVGSADTGEDGTLTVEALAALTLSPATVELRAGESFSLTTVGVVDGAAPINVTQDALYASSDPSVVTATNQAGNKSRITALAPGVATVTASRASSYPQATESNAITVTVLPAP